MWNLTIQRDSEQSLARQIYQQIRDLILQGALPANEAMPSTRGLAQELRVSRNTVTEAYEMLIAEGYLDSQQGAPTRVAKGISPQPSVKSQACPMTPATANRQPIQYDFHTGRPDLKQFPITAWRKAAQSALESATPEAWDYDGADGLPALRLEIAAWLFRSRGIAPTAENIFITAGSTHALCVAADLMSESGRSIIVEDPCHIGMYRVLKNRKIQIVPVRVDQLGIQVDQFPWPDAAAVYVTPSHQFPLGSILPAERRIKLIRQAIANDQYIIEDDYDSEFRYCGEPLTPLWGLAPDRVIYIGTFSKALFPAIRIGFAIVPPQLQKKWRYYRTHIDVQNPPFEQMALTKFMASRQFDRHLRNMNKLYNRKRNSLLTQLYVEFTDEVEVLGDASGLHLAVTFPDRQFDPDFSAKSLQEGVHITTAARHSILNQQFNDTLLLGYGHLDLHKIPAAAAALIALIHKHSTFEPKMS